MKSSGNHEEEDDDDGKLLDQQLFCGTVRRTYMLIVVSYLLLTLAFFLTFAIEMLTNEQSPIKEWKHVPMVFYVTFAYLYVQCFIVMLCIAKFTSPLRILIGAGIQNLIMVFLFCRMKMFFVNTGLVDVFPYSNAAMFILPPLFFLTSLIFVLALLKVRTMRIPYDGPDLYRVIYGAEGSSTRNGYMEVAVMN